MRYAERAGSSVDLTGGLSDGFIQKANADDKTILNKKMQKIIQSMINFYMNNVLREFIYD